MSQLINEEAAASPNSFPLFNEELVEPLQIGGLGVQLLQFIQPLRSAKRGILSLPRGFTQKEYHSVKEPDETPQEDALEIGYVHNMELPK